MGVREARYRQIYRQLRAQILSGAYQPGDKLPTEMKLAALYGVSRITSAAALTELAREGLVQRVPRRGTTVIAPAERESSPRRPLLAWIQPSLDPSIGLNLLRGIERATRLAGYNLLVHLTGTSRAEEEEAIRNAVAAGADGLALFLQDGETYNGEVLRLVLDRYPLVLVDRYLRGLPCACVQSDNTAGAREAMLELVRAGHRHICTIIFPPTATSTIEDRLEGCAQAVATTGVAFDRSLVYVAERFSIDFIETGAMPNEEVERLAAYLRRTPRVSAVFATNATLALLALRAAERLGRCIPADLSIACIDPVQAFPLPVPAVTCAVQQGVEIGRTAVDLLREQLAGEPPRRVMLPMVIERAGTVAPPKPRS